MIFLDVTLSVISAILEQYINNKNGEQNLSWNVYYWYSSTL